MVVWKWGGRERGMSKESKETLGSNTHVHSFYCDDDFLWENICQNVSYSISSLNMYGLIMLICIYNHFPDDSNAADLETTLGDYREGGCSYFGHLKITWRGLKIEIMISVIYGETWFGNSLKEWVILTQPRWKAMRIEIIY